MLFKNARIENAADPCDFRVEDGLFSEFGKLKPEQGEEVVDLGQRLVLPPFVESVNFALQLAKDMGKLVDVHCDEIDDEASRGLETVAARALELELFDKVTVSHTTAMHSYNNAYVLKLMRLLKMSRINFVANPLINTHLQGRADTYPKRRGITRVKELQAEGLNVSFGHDDISDHWYPMGNGNLRDVVFLGCMSVS